MLALLAFSDWNQFVASAEDYVLKAPSSLSLFEKTGTGGSSIPKKKKKKLELDDIKKNQIIASRWSQHILSSRLLNILELTGWPLCSPYKSCS